MYGHQRGKAARGGGCGVMNWEIGVDMYRPMCIKWMTNKKKKKKIYIYIYIYIKRKTTQHKQPSLFKLLTMKEKYY